jgi:hypothetical protein
MFGIVIGGVEGGIDVIQRASRMESFADEGPIILG